MCFAAASPSTASTASSAATMARNAGYRPRADRHRRTAGSAGCSAPARTSQRKQFRQRLRQEQKAALREAQAIAHLGAGGWISRSEQLTWSKEVYRIFGVAGETALTLDDFVARIHPEDRGGCSPSGRPPCGASLRQRAPHPGGDTIRWVRGAPTSVSTTPASRAVGGRPVAGMSAERHQAEEQLRKLSLAIGRSHNIVITNTEPKIGVRQFHLRAQYRLHAGGHSARIRAS